MFLRKKLKTVASYYFQYWTIPSLSRFPYQGTRQGKKMLRCYPRPVVKISIIQLNELLVKSQRSTYCDLEWQVSMSQVIFKDKYLPHRLTLHTRFYCVSGQNLKSNFLNIRFANSHFWKVNSVECNDWIWNYILTYKNMNKRLVSLGGKKLYKFTINVRYVRQVCSWSVNN